MDGGDVESGDGLHEDQRRLQKLLWQAAGAALGRMGISGIGAGFVLLSEIACYL